jgi:hypothetical protein
MSVSGEPRNHMHRQHQRDSPTVTVPVRGPARKCTSHFSSLEQLWLAAYFWTCWKTGCYPNWIPVMTVTFCNWTELPHFHTSVPVLLNRVLPQRWIWRAANGDNNLLPWPPRSPDLTPCDFYLWGFVRDSVYVLPLPRPSRNFVIGYACAAGHYSAQATPSLGWVWLPCGCVSRDSRWSHIEGL